MIRRTPLFLQKDLAIYTIIEIYSVLLLTFKTFFPQESTIESTSHVMIFKDQIQYFMDYTLI